MLHSCNKQPIMLTLNVDTQQVQEAAVFCATHSMCNEQCPIWKALLEHDIAVTPDKCRDIFATAIYNDRTTSEVDVTACAEAVQQHCQAYTCLYCNFRTTKEVTIDSKKVQVLDCKLHADNPEEWRLEDGHNLQRHT